MNINWVWFLIVVVSGLIFFLVRLYRKLVNRAAAHKEAMIQVAKRYGLALAPDDDSSVSMKLMGVVDGVQIVLFSAIKKRVGGLRSITQVTAMSNDPECADTHLVEEGFVVDERILIDLIERAVADVLA
jgi:hypothetical protein